MKKIFTLAFLLSLVSLTFSQTGSYSRVKIDLRGKDITALAKLGIPLEGRGPGKDQSVVAELSQGELLKLKAAGFPYEVLIGDVTAFYARRAAETASTAPEQKGQAASKFFAVPGSYPVPYEFSYGSMGGYFNYEQMIAQLDTMYAHHPDLITQKQQIGTATSIEGRPIYWVKISHNPNISENEPQVLYTGLHHAREPQGMTNLIFYMYYLLEHYDGDLLIHSLLDNTELYFVICVNPDGYKYNCTNSPGGGGMWRKNRRNSGGGTYGVDLNRNYGYMWGCDDVGSSPIPSDETYRGTAAFSEPETQIIRDFCNAHDFRLCLNYHTYADDLLYPWGYTDLTPCPDDNIFSSYADLMTRESNYLYGATGPVLYLANGGSDDWMYGEQVSKPKMFAYTCEVGNSNDGFWPAQNRIIPLAQENMLMNLLFGLLGGKYANVTEASPAIFEQQQGYLAFNIQRLGLETPAAFTVSLQPLSLVSSTGGAKVFSSMNLLETRTDSISYVLDPSVQSGQKVKFLLTLDNGSYSLTDTITKIYGQPVVVFNDDCNSLANWTAGNWGLSYVTYHSATASITDSPSGNYQNNANKSVTLNTSLNLTNAAAAILNFWARWDLEAGYDYVQCRISTDNGATWNALAGKYTHAGTMNQAVGEPVYDGTQSAWVKETIDLQDYTGFNVKLRFTLVSDYFTNGDGFYFDDLTVTTVDFVTSTDDLKVQNGLFLSEPMPNPASGSVKIACRTPVGTGSLNIEFFSPEGVLKETVAAQAGAKELNLPVSSWKPGVYYYRLRCGKMISPARKLIVM